MTQYEIRALCPECDQELEIRLDDRKMMCKTHHEVDSFRLKLDHDSKLDLNGLGECSLSTLAVAWCRIIRRICKKKIEESSFFQNSAHPLRVISN